MAVTVYIPTSLRRFTQNHSKVEVEGRSLRALIGELEGRFPGLGSHLVDGSGQLLPYVSVFVNQEPVDNLDQTSLKDGDEIALIPALAGGC